MIRKFELTAEELLDALIHWLEAERGQSFQNDDGATVTAASPAGATLTYDDAGEN